MATSALTERFVGTITMDFSAAPTESGLEESLDVESGSSKYLYTLKSKIRSDQFTLKNLADFELLRAAVGDQAEVIERLWNQNRVLISIVLQKLWQSRGKTRAPRIRFSFDSIRFWFEVYFYVNLNKTSTPIEFGISGFDREEDCQIEDCRVSQFILRTIDDNKDYGWESAERIAAMEPHPDDDNFDLLFVTSVCNVDNPDFFQELINFIKTELDDTKAERVLHGEEKSIAKQEEKSILFEKEIAEKMAAIEEKRAKVERLERDNKRLAAENESKRTQLAKAEQIKNHYEALLRAINGC